MAEPEELIIEGAHVATRLARDVWQRYARTEDGAVSLASVRPRLELFLTALFGRTIPIAAAEPPAPQSWLARLAYGRPQERLADPVTCGTDGRRIFLPPRLPLADGEEQTVARFRLLALEQAGRLVRGTPDLARAAGSRHVRDVFLLAEAAVIDGWIARHVPGLLPVLTLSRAAALSHRLEQPRRPFGLSPAEPAVRRLLASDPAARILDGLPADASPAISLAWAHEEARRSAVTGPYRPLIPVGYWGRMLDPADPGPPGQPARAEEPQPAAGRPRVAEMRRRPKPRTAPEDEDDEGTGTWVIRADEPQESVEDPFGLQRPMDHDEDADPEGLGDSLSDLPEARVVRMPGQPREVLRSGEELTRAAMTAPAAAKAQGFAYPEWDCRQRRYRMPGAIVREPHPALGDEAWVAATLAKNARLVRRVRTRFERLRPRPMRLDRQLDGSGVDIAAYVRSIADARSGVPIDGRLYTAERPARRELAVALLVDVSASTDSWVSETRRIVDVEKEALLVVCEALDALGDRYGIFAFSGESAEDVAVLPLKAFDERIGPPVRRRIAALDADRYTRMGAPIRHLTAVLGRQHASRRLLLILSDGKPNDVDLYEGQYGVEDTRQAAAEARRQGVSVFCLTVDREAPRYAGRIFGHAGYGVLHSPQQLPAVLIDVLRQLIRW